MTTNPAFDDIIGQNAPKQTLSLYIDSFRQTSRLPFLNFLGGKGQGKTHLAKTFRAALVKPDGKKPAILEVNMASIKNADAFFEQVYPVWVSNECFLFADEFHNTPKDLQQLFLSIFNVEKSPIRTISHGGLDYQFDFTKISFGGSTTDQQKLCEPLRDRLRNIVLEDYKPEELFEIFEKNLEFKVEIEPNAREAIISTFRGNPRDAVVKAEDLKTYVSAIKKQKINLSTWNDFCKTMGINPFGLSAAELILVKILGKRGESSLNALSSISGFERSVIQKDYEKILFKKGLLQVDGKRKLSADGVRFYHKYCQT